MNGISAFQGLGDDALLGRDPMGVIDEYRSLGSDDDERLTAVEHRAMGALLERRAEALPITPGRAIAVDLLPGAAMTCRDMLEVDVLLAEAQAWADAMGDVRAHARSVDARREAGDPCPDAAATLHPVIGAEIVLDVHDATRLSATLVIPGEATAIVGIHHIDQDRENGAAEPVPELAA